MDHMEWLLACVERVNGMRWIIRAIRIVFIGISAIICLLLVGYVLFLVIATLFYGMPLGSP